MRFSRIFYSLTIHILKAELSLKIIDSVVDEIENENPNLKIKSSIFNPIYGYVFLKSGGLHNLRFYGPKLTMDFKNGIRNYVEDKSDDLITKLTIELFKSQSGILGFFTGAPSNFGNKIKNLSDKSSYLSKLFLSIYENKDVGIFKNIKNCVLKDVANLFLNGKNIPTIFRSEKDLKLIIIYSFIIKAFDTKEELKSFLKEICDYPGLKIDHDYNLGFDVIKEILKIEEIFNSFPYSETNPPSSNVYIPYCRRLYPKNANTISDYTDKEQIKKYYEKNFEFDTKTFPDCADITLLHICNCILYDSQNYSNRTIYLEKDSDIFVFYNINKDLYSITNEIRNKWSTVIQGLDGFPNKDDSEFKLHEIVYKYNENEVAPGIINMMNILI